MAFLRQLSKKGIAEERLLERLQLDTKETVLGRDSKNKVVIDSKLYGMVSRRHAAIRRETGTTNSKSASWVIGDLNSANGTYLNGQKLQGWERLKEGDRIALGQNGPEFVIEELDDKPNYPASLPIVTSNLEKDSLTLTQLFPIISTGRQLGQKAYLYPAIFTIVCVVLMFLTIGDSQAFNFLTAVYISVAAYYFIYRLCGKRKPWWVLLGSGFFTIVILSSPILNLFIIVFRHILPGNILVEPDEVGFLSLLVRMFFGAGLMEELLKALPVFAALFLGRLLPYRWQQKIGVIEPLDAILLATASAVGFTLLETLGQYVPIVVYNASIQAGENVAQLQGLQLLIPRVLGMVCGHMAYSGYFGYFIGLSALRGRNSCFILGIGYLTSAFIHALWNAAGLLSVVMLVIVGVLSYAFLAAAILKARAISPTREKNFATRLK